MRPRNARRALAVSAATLAIGFLGIGPVAAQAPAPAPAPATGQSAPPKTAPTSSVDVRVEDPGNKLSGSDHTTLATETARIALPPQVKQVNFIAFDTINGSLNDATLNWVGAHRPDLVPDGTGNGAKWAPGTLIVAVSTGAREVGMYCGDDVCSALELFAGPHLDRALADMKPPLKDSRENVALAMLDGVRTAADPTLVTEKSSVNRTAVVALGGTALAGGAGIVSWAVVWGRRKQTATAKSQFQHLSKGYSDAAQRLDQIDIRANSLTSPVADAELRRQWDEVRTQFVEVGDKVSESGLTLDSPDSEFRKHAKEIGVGDEALTRLENAEQSIERIFAMEHGDDAARHQEATQLAEDISSAAVDAKDGDLKRRLEELEHDVLALRENRGAADFMDRYAEHLRSYAHLLELVRKAQLKDLDTKAKDRHAPRIYDSGYRVGHGYGGWVPYHYLNSWNSDDAQAASGSSSTNTSYSSGFSGGGGSSGY